MDKNKLIEKPDWEMLGKYLSHETTESETKMVENWINQSVKNREELDKIRLMLEQADSFYKLKQYDSEVAWEKVSEKLEATPAKVRQLNFRKKGIKTFYKYAAVLLIALLLGTTGYYIGFKNPLQEISSAEIASNFQNSNEYLLPDGSTVTLNSGSKISYPKRFKSDIREVNITGEAFFDVKSNPEKPFVINAGEAKITVLGTSFNVSAYPENEQVEVVVETGRVEVSHKKDAPSADDEKILLKPGEKGTLLEKQNILAKSINTDRNYLAWKTHNLVFDETPMKQVIGCLQKVYHIEIQLENEEINDLLLTAEFDKKPVDFVLNVVKLTFDLDLYFENDKYILANHINNNN